MVLIIERALIKKPKLGGWLNELTCDVYENAESQTGPPPPKVPPERKCSRQVQTAVLVDKNIQTPYERATQVWRSVSSIIFFIRNDKLIFPIQRYFLIFMQELFFF